MMAYEWVEKEYDGGAPATTLNGAISGASTTITLTSGSGLPDGTLGMFVLALDYGLVTEEKILVLSRSGVTLTVQLRGYDGSTAQAHADLAPVVHVLDAHSMQQANALAVAMGTAGSMAFRGAGNTYTELPIGTAGDGIVVAGGIPTYGPVVPADDSVTAAKLATGAVTSAKILDGTIATGDIADSAITSAKIADGTIATGDIADSAITSAKIADGTIVNADINASAAIAATKLVSVMVSSSGANRTMTVSDSAASGTPLDGDVWFEY